MVCSVCVDSGTIKFADLTDLLMKQRYFPSYNVPWVALSLTGLHHYSASVSVWTEAYCILWRALLMIGHGVCQDSLLVRVPDLWWKDYEFESWPEQWENFLLQSELCVLSLIPCPLNPCVTTVSCKRPRSFWQKCRWQVTLKHAYTLDSTKLEWADYAAVQA